MKRVRVDETSEQKEMTAIEFYQKHEIKWVIYSVGINLCYFYIQSNNNGRIVKFVSRIGKQKCDNLLDLLDCDRLYPSEKSTRVLECGNPKKKPEPTTDDIIDEVSIILEENKIFNWLHDFIETEEKHVLQGIHFCDKYDIEWAIYSPGINWCWFYIQCKGRIARFRLHMEERKCWDLLELLDCDRLYPSETIRSTHILKYGNKEKKQEPTTTDIIIGEDSIARANEIFKWLKEFFEHHNCFETLQWYGVVFQCTPGPDF